MSSARAGDDPATGDPRPLSATDVRGRGFSSRAALSVMEGWIDATVGPLPPRAVPLAAIAATLAEGPVLAEPVSAPGDWPSADRAARDGVAVASSDTLGAGSYNPVPLPGAVTVAAGEPMPPGTDAILPVECIQTDGPFVEALNSVAPGDGVERRGEGLRAGTVLLKAGHRLRPQDLGLFAALGIDVLCVGARPRVRIVLAGGPRSGPETLGAMLAALVARDGGVAELVGPLPADRAALAAAYAAPGADLLISAGRTGVGEDDVAPLALADAGMLALHGVALRPGDSAALGTAGGVPAVLLPGEPMACLTAYELLAGRALRRLAGRDPALPHPAVPAVTVRKLVSEIGCTELYRVRRTADGLVEPVASPHRPGLAGAVLADGFVLIPAESEGVPAGATVTLRCFDGTSL
ncbi:molybdopterin biosynthesis protein [Azospirillum brasilense]|uniref:Molybdopterin molybdenumtransferase n=1 Tax=Azospirillum brasilense TaxID=192 RepID=A0A0P0F871_AZOBR|nr:molybdopterin biosynthesis protein [Azospirillum brasilense]PWC93794.1 molybdopterin biosynthesis protein [Azospirillum sp. Sp 7]OPH13559.1 molybdopterin biosynthesis protein [Azospirillum brasilense]OPH20934.1 molybdopterin biosynthesis protein [Azospirillum brasilense]QCO08791.1 molybdopterin biosynthesis protein [Azospirillum brasilense]